MGLQTKEVPIWNMDLLLVCFVCFVCFVKIIKVLFSFYKKDESKERSPFVSALAWWKKKLELFDCCFLLTEIWISTRKLQKIGYGQRMKVIIVQFDYFYNGKHKLKVENPRLIMKREKRQLIKSCLSHFFKSYNYQFCFVKSRTSFWER